MKTQRAFTNATRLATAALMPGACLGAGTALGQAEIDRTVLPIQFSEAPRVTEMDASKVPVPPRQQVRAPADAPNVLVILIDDIGFGGTEVFGGPIKAPTFDRFAKGGLRYNNFHTTALSSPTRAALKSGRNHHTCNMGFITEMGTGFRGATGEIPNSVAPLAENPAPKRV